MIIAPWGLSIKPGATYKYEIPAFANLKISNAALGAELEDEHSRTTLTIETEERPPADSEDKEDQDEDEDEPQPTHIVLTSLTPGKIEQSIHDITFSFPAMLKIKAIGKNTIHLGGNLVAEPETDDSNSEFGYLDDEDVGDLDELSSDVDAIELDDASTDEDRFEEVDDIPQASLGLKRPREDDMSEDEDEDEAKQVALTKSKKKKLNKKLKATNGEAIPVGAPPADKKEEKGKGKESESLPEASKKEGKEKKKEHKKEEKEKKKEEKTEKKEKKEKKKEQANGAPTASTSADPSSNQKILAGGLVIEDSKVGTGKTAKAGSVCAMRYIGKLSDGTVFDSNTKGQPFTFKLGSGQVIKGWDQGIAGMQEGSERVLIVPPALAYGKKKMPQIPSNSTLRFERCFTEVKMLSIK